MIEVTAYIWITNEEANVLVWQQYKKLLHLLGICIRWAEFYRSLLTGEHDLVLRPVEEELLVGAHRNRLGTNAFRRDTGAAIGAAGIKRPEACRVLSAAGIARCVIQIRQAKIVTELMGEHAHAAIFRFDGVIANPVVGATDLNTTKAMRTYTIRTIGAEIGIPTMAPDGIGTLGTTTGFFTRTRVDGLEMVDITIGFIEVTITIRIVTIPDIILG